MRDTIFISHATPQDNEFAIWFASRLELLGYKVWIDKDALLGGEKIWENIDKVIRDETIKFLLVYSKNIFQKDNKGDFIIGKLKDGIYKEFSFAESIAKSNNLTDFIILLNIDKADYNLFIGADRLNQIPFYNNWAVGLNQLEKKLVKDDVPKNSQFQSTGFGEWYEGHFINPTNITQRYELYYSNWWAIPNLPEHFFIYQFANAKQVNLIIKQNLEFPKSKISNNLSSFQEFSSFEIFQNEETISIKPQYIYKIKVEDVLHGFESNIFPNHKDAENHFKFLLKMVFHQIMKNRGMFWYEMANKRYAYYYTTSNLTNLKVKFKYPYRKGNIFKMKNLIGKHTSKGKWHYAVSVLPILSPILGFSLKNHITFTNDGLNVWKTDKQEIDKEKIHRERRNKGKRLFNEEWRDLLLAFINALKKGEKIEIQLASNFVLEMPFFPEMFWADFGYFDPRDKTRQGLLSMYDFEEDNIEENE
ncbi:MAG: toll/interleukin-1 receptor domain-containing protein [Candidatus Kapaibacterium sp.]